MSGKVYDGQDSGNVPDNPEFPQNHSDERDEGNMIDYSGFPKLQPDEHDGGHLPEDANHPENNFDGNDDEGLPENPDFPPQEHSEEQHGGGGDVPENFGSEEKQGSEEESKESEIKKWPGWPGTNVFRILVPVKKVGSIIGRKGEVIKKITQETKTRIKILDGPPGTSERAVIISAKEEPDRSIPPAVDGLLRVHKQVVNLDPRAAVSTSGAGRQIVTRLLVADTQALSLIGKQGSTLKSFQDAAGCNIRVRGSGVASGVHKTVELIAINLRKFFVDWSIVEVFVTQMQWPDVRSNHNMPPSPPHQPWGPPRGFPAPGPGSGGGPSFPPNPRYMRPSHNYDNYYPPADLLPMDKHLHQGPAPAYARDSPMGIHQSSAQPQQSIVTKRLLLEQQGQESATSVEQVEQVLQFTRPGQKS